MDYSPRNLKEEKRQAVVYDVFEKMGLDDIYMLGQLDMLISLKGSGILEVEIFNRILENFSTEDVSQAIKEYIKTL